MVLKRPPEINTIQWLNKTTFHQILRSNLYITKTKDMRWVSELIPRFTKIFEYRKIFDVIVSEIKNSAFIQNLSPNAHPGVE